MRRFLSAALEENANFAAGRLAMARNEDGTLSVFYVGPGLDVVHARQLTPSGGWTPWQWLTNTSLQIRGQSLAVTSNQDGRLELFLVGTGDLSSADGGDLLHCSQTSPSGPFGEWEFLAPVNSILSPRNGNVIATGCDANGHLWVFAIRPDHGVYALEQAEPGAPFSDWVRLTNTDMDIRGTSLTVVRNPGGWLELFLVGTGRDILHMSQTPDGAWTPWRFRSGQGMTAEPHPGTTLTAAVNSDGTLELFTLGASLEVFRCREISPGGEWTQWEKMTSPVGPIFGTSLAVGQNQDGRLELFLVGTGRDILQAWQQSPSGPWTPWVWRKERDSTLEVAVCTNLNGTLEAFNIGTRQEVLHNWQSTPSGGWQPAWALRENGASTITNDVPQTEEMRQRIATEFSLPGIGSEVLAIHAATLPTGDVLYFGGSQYSGLQPTDGPYEAAANSTRLWRATTGSVEQESSPIRGDEPSRLQDVFCSGHAFLPDGRLLVAGGYGGVASRQGILVNTGLRNTSIYNPTTRQWTVTGDMCGNPGQPDTPNTGGSWYPTLLTLASGKVLSMLGAPAAADLRRSNTTVELFDPATGLWSDQSSDVPTSSAGDMPAYPRLHQLPDGRVFSTTPLRGASGEDAPHCYTWDPRTREWKAVSAPPADCEFDLWSRLTTSVLLPLRASEGYKARVLVVGANVPQILDPSQPSPSWQATAARALAGSPCRYNCNAIILPTGQILVAGGHSDHDSGDESTVVLGVELYDPALDRWQVVTDALVPRQYHTSAVLLRDGRVWIAGSQARCDAGLGTRELRIEVISPPYLFWGARPMISSAPESLTPRAGEAFSIITPQASTIASVTLVRCGSATHGYDSDQRCVELSILDRTTTSLWVSLPPDNNIVPPGYYFLFAIGNNKVPSYGHSVRIASP